MSTRDITREEFEKSLLSYGITLKWYEPPKDWQKSECAHLLLHGEYFGYGYALRKGSSRRANRAALIKIVEESTIPSRISREKREMALILYDALKQLVEHPGVCLESTDAIRAMTVARAALDAATYNPMRNIELQEKKRAQTLANIEAAKIPIGQVRP